MVFRATRLTWGTARQWLRSAFPLAAILVTVLAVPRVGADEINVKILFDGNCPIKVSDPQVVLEKGRNDNILWTSYNKDGSQPVRVAYSIYFDPFVGRPLADSNGDGVLRSPNVKATSPKGVYKYTVLGNECSGDALDPNIVVR
ncbi:MAG: hypothetical protein P8Y92_14420 [Halioglobus sp.]